MYFQSKNFIVRKLKLEDKEHIKALEESRPWAKGLLEFKDSLPGGDKFDYFEKLWADYIKMELFEQLIEEVVKESGAKHLEFELWNDKDRSKVIFEEAGYDMESGAWEYGC